MTDFAETYKRLNAEQKKAVDTIDGPLLVIAGPGTGKTQLLSARVANILKITDTLPQNILCLTFTESGARAMRERLTSMIGTDAYDVHISTYHAFGSEIIGRYPEFFESIKLDRTEDIRFERPIDELAQLQLIVSIIDELPFDNPLSNARYYPKDIIGTISELKRGLVSPDKLCQVATDNLTTIEAVSPDIQDTFGKVGRIPKYDKAADIFSRILDTLRSQTSELAEKASADLDQALDEAAGDSTTKPLTAWKNDWLHKNEDGEWEFTNPLIHQKLRALADVYETYEKSLRSTGTYDYDDMIVAVIDALRTKPELKANLQENYHYLLLDEFQDTNAAQFELVHQIADHPVHEGQPNVMAVGDDDQAIFAFQGADVSNMMKLKDSFKDVRIINLVKNYRSHHNILHVAHNIADQIESRLHHQLDNVDKTLEAASENLPKEATIERHEFSAQASEYHWIAAQIKQRIDSGTPPEEIAVLAPKHALLEALVPFLQKASVPVSYEKRENILETPIIQGLVLQCRLLAALANQDHAKANELFPQVLSLDFWNVATENIWRVNWAHSKSSYKDQRAWADLALDDDQLADWVRFFLQLSAAASTMPLEYVLDSIIGTREVELSDDRSIVSPLRDYYFSEDKKSSSSTDYYEAISHLSVIRNKLREHQQNSDSLLRVGDFLTFYDAHQAAEQPIINSHPIAQAKSAVLLMTTYKAKGLEFTSVFLPSLHDNVWGKKARSGSNKLGLPANLEHIRYRGSSEDELRRLLFVAITRAKEHLYLSSHALSDSGKANEPVKYLAESADPDGVRNSQVLPNSASTVTAHEDVAEELAEHIETLWQARHLTLDAPLKSLLKERLDSYQMSPTHVNTFTDLIYGGPEAFLLGTLLRFPQAPNEAGEFGNAIHATLEKLQRFISEGNQLDKFDHAEVFTAELKRRYLPKDRFDYYLDKGASSLNRYVAARQDMLSRPAQSEVDFRREGVLVNEAHLSGKIDRLEVDADKKLVHIVDYKTGTPHNKWASNLGLHKYKQQLYFYKLLIEGSHSYQNYRVASARLEFVEPRQSGTIADPLNLDFNEKEEAELKELIQAVWSRIKTLDLPDISGYKPSLPGIKQFEKDLISSKE